MSEHAFALLHDDHGLARIVRLDEKDGHWRAFDIAQEDQPHAIESWELVHPHDLATRRLTLEEAREALREWEEAFSLSQSFVVRPYSPLKSWNDKWG